MGDCDWHHHHHGSGTGALYGLGVIGAAVYFVQASTGFWAGVLGVVKAFFWPAFAVFKAFTLLQI